MDFTPLKDFCPAECITLVYLVPILKLSESDRFLKRQGDQNSLHGPL